MGKANTTATTLSTITTSHKAYKYLGDQVAIIWKVLYEKTYKKSIGYSTNCQARTLEISLGN